MTTILFLFLIALGLALVLTPLVKGLGARLGAVDIPAERKVHSVPIPRIGGLAVFIAFAVTVALTNLYNTTVSRLFVFDQRTAFGLYGALVVFGCGLWDDFRRLNPWVKLLFQVAGASIAFAGGISIGGFFIGSRGLQFGVLSYAITVFWFVLFINAVNLIDGLDGLAGGVVFFTCLLMIILSVLRADYLSGIYFAALGGAVLGFLRYNFNPASIFLGDGGSYFLGYSVAALSIMGSVKSQVGALMLIPLLALGVPVFDTIFSPVRRWVKGRRIFQADKGHIHHRLLNIGLSSRNAVLILYGATMALCILAILIVNLRNEMVGLILAILGFGALILVRRTGYLGYLALDKFYGWFRDVTDVAGFSRERRTFLALQIDASRTQTLDELWAHVGEALEMLKFDRAELHLKNRDSSLFSDAAAVDSPGKAGTAPDLSEGQSGAAPVFPSPTPVSNDGTQNSEGTGTLFSQSSALDSYDGPERRQTTGRDSRQQTTQKIFNDVRQQGDETVRIWVNGHYRRATDCLPDGMLKIDLPLDSNGARLLLMKDLRRDPLNYYTLRRLEHLRRTLLSNL
ncbi:MAG: undecaprenyl/decaprenyl-phosphate alpha-N-acetylglucosaminyl 1-phosphate transferase, partial [Deltaproteobacteria bacterium]|nr:undecaprenyl/decaprenyl-phosphate alpha-N-acetylglucosaminyl 1-phosphate transferase [Deltaproteobacteria bacterium]